MKVLVANRGEIAARLLQALVELEIESVAIHTEKDHLHVAHATQAVRVPAASSFMDEGLILKLAQENHCDAIVPGYGFLSESARFAESCENAGILFVGPSSRVLANLGDKASAKAIAKRLSVPILPSAEIENSSDVLQFARRVGFPIMIKAQDGGGGKGIRIVQRDDEIETLLQEAMNESPSRQVFVEKAALEGYKHIEIQVIGDKHGNIRTLFERECSLQRKFQKIVELAPSSLSRSRIEPIVEAAARMAKHVAYLGLGTFEFLVHHQRDEYYFMECNPRIQVEHTVTEQVTGLDLAHLLFAVTLQNLDLSTVPLPREPLGFSIQCRVNAENPASFETTLGSIDACRLPAGPGIRTDSILSHLGPGQSYVVTDEYDSLLSKVITTSSTFATALQRAQYAMKMFSVGDFVTNQPLLLGLLHSELMANPSAVDITSLSRGRVVETLLAAGTHSLESSLQRPQPPSADSSTPGPRSLTQPASSSSSSSIFKKGDRFEFTLGSATAAAAGPPRLLQLTRILKNDFPTHLAAEISLDGGVTQQTVSVKKATTGATTHHRKADRLDPSHVVLPFSGILVEVLVERGDEVAEAETIALFRQGKMELDVRAPMAGTVVDVAEFKEGESVGVGALVAIVQGANRKARL